MITRNELGKYKNRDLEFYQNRNNKNYYKKNQIIIINDNRSFSKYNYIYKVKIIDVLNEHEFNKDLDKRIKDLNKIKQLKDYVVKREKFNDNYEYEELYIRKLELINKKIKNNTLRKIFYMAQFKQLSQKYTLSDQAKHLRVFNDLVEKTIKLEVRN